MPPAPRRTFRSGAGGAFRTVAVSALVVAALGWPLPSSARSAAQVGTEVPMTATDQRAPAANNSPVLVADPSDSRFVVAAHRLDAPTFGCGLQVSGNGGHGWVGAAPVPNLPSGVDTCYAPEVIFDREGTLYYLFSGLHGLGNEPVGIFLATSRDRGRTFSSPWEVLGPERYMVRMAIDPTLGKKGRIYLTWLEVAVGAPLGGLSDTGSPILAAYSDDEGRTFSRPARVSDPTRRRVVAPALAIATDHTVYVAYFDLQDDARDYQGLEGPAWDGTWTLALAKSDDHGLTYQPGKAVDEKLVPAGRVMLIYTMPPASLAVDRSGRVLVSWSDARNGNSDVFLSSSTNRGVTWMAPRRLNDDPVESRAEQYLPRLAVAPNGRIDVVFLDRRNDPKNERNDTYYTSSPDARRFEPNLKLTNKSSDSGFGQQYLVPSAKGLVDFGSRLGLLARDSSVVAAWPDTRNVSRPGSRQQDIFSTEVQRADGGHSGRGSLWAIFATLVLLAGAVYVTVGARRVVKSRRFPGQAHALTEQRVVRRWMTGVLAVIGLSVGSCSPVGSPESGAGLPPRPLTFDVVMRDYAFDHAATVDAGRVVFRVQNAGTVSHEMVLVALPEDFPPIDEQLRGDVRRPLGIVNHLANRSPGTSDIFAADLFPGRYAMICFRADADGAPHFAKGMDSEFRVEHVRPSS